MNKYILSIIATGLLAVLVYFSWPESKTPVEVVLEPLGAVDALILPEQARQAQCFNDYGRYCDRKVITTDGVEVTSWSFTSGIKPGKKLPTRGYNIVTKYKKDGIFYTQRIYRHDDGYGFVDYFERPVPPPPPPAVATTSENI